MNITDLPLLQSIQLGEIALYAVSENSSSLIMHSLNILLVILNADLPNLTTIASEGNSLCYPHSVTLNSIYS